MVVPKDITDKAEIEKLSKQGMSNALSEV